jgi:PAS domain-containing protein
VSPSITEQAFDEAPVALVTVDEAGRVVAFNRAFRGLRRLAEVGGEVFSDVLEEDRAVLRDALVRSATVFQVACEVRWPPARAVAGWCAGRAWAGRPSPATWPRSAAMGSARARPAGC